MEGLRVNHVKRRVLATIALAAAIAAGTALIVTVVHDRTAAETTVSCLAVDRAVTDRIAGRAVGIFVPISARAVRAPEIEDRIRYYYSGYYVVAMRFTGPSGAVREGIWGFATNDGPPDGEARLTMTGAGSGNSIIPIDPAAAAATDWPQGGELAVDENVAAVHDARTCLGGTD